MAMLDRGREHHDRSALVLYGSETGTAQDVASELGGVLGRLHFSTRVAELNSVDIVRLPVGGFPKALYI